MNTEFSLVKCALVKLEPVQYSTSVLRHVAPIPQLTVISWGGEYKET